MVNGLGVVGWGVGGIEAEAAMLGQPISMLIPQVLGVRLTGALPQGATATDLVLTITEILRKHGVVGKFVEFFGEGLRHLTIADRATLGNMCPEYGATVAIFPIDEMTLDYLRLTGRDESRVRARRGVRAARRGCSAPTTVLRRSTPRPSSSICRPSSRASPVRSVRRIACRCTRAKAAFQTRAADDAGAGEGGHKAADAGGARQGVADEHRRGRAVGRRGARSGARRARSRRGRHRRDHELHEHVESERDDRRRPAWRRRRSRRG